MPSAFVTTTCGYLTSTSGAKLGAGDQVEEMLRATGFTPVPDTKEQCWRKDHKFDSGHTAAIVIFAPPRTRDWTVKVRIIDGAELSHRKTARMHDEALDLEIPSNFDITNLSRVLGQAEDPTFDRFQR